MKTTEEILKENLIYAMRHQVPNEPYAYYEERINGWFSGTGDFGDEHSAMIATFQQKAMEDYATQQTKDLFTLDQVRESIRLSLEPIVRMKEPWPLKDILRKLAEASHILLHKQSYDGQGYESINMALSKGEEVLKVLNDLSESNYKIVNNEL